MSSTLASHTVIELPGNNNDGEIRKMIFTDELIDRIRYSESNRIDLVLNGHSALGARQILQDCVPEAFFVFPEAPAKSNQLYILLQPPHTQEIIQHSTLTESHSFGHYLATRFFPRYGGAYALSQLTATEIGKHFTKEKRRNPDNNNLGQSCELLMHATLKMLWQTFRAQPCVEAAVLLPNDQASINELITGNIQTFFNPPYAMKIPADGNCHIMDKAKNLCAAEYDSVLLASVEQSPRLYLFDSTMKEERKALSYKLKKAEIYRTSIFAECMRDNLSFHPIGYRTVNRIHFTHKPSVVVAQKSIVGALDHVMHMVQTAKKPYAQFQKYIYQTLDDVERIQSL